MKSMSKLFRAVMIGALALACAGQTLAQDYFVSDRGGNQVLRFGSDGSYKGVFVTPGDGGLIRPTTMALVPTSTGTELWVGSGESNQLKRYNSTTGAFISNVVADNSMAVGDILYDQTTNSVFVSNLGVFDGVNPTPIVFPDTRKFSTSGTLTTSFGVGTASSGMAINGNTLYVRNFGSGGVDTYSASNPSTATNLIPTAGTGVGGSGLLQLSTGDLLLSNNFLFKSTPTTNLEIQRFNSAGVLQTPDPFIGQYNPATPTAGGTAYTFGMLQVGNTLLVSNFGNNNPNDPYYDPTPLNSTNNDSTLFNGFVSAYSLSGTFLGPSQFISFTPSSGFFQPSDIILAPSSIPEPSTFLVVAGLGLCGIVYRVRNRRTA
ncbi:MAG: PEP-CTERM sorting domain-containing protein [Pirellulales bacterium]